MRFSQNTNRIGRCNITLFLWLTVTALLILGFSLSLAVIPMHMLRDGSLHHGNGDLAQNLAHVAGDYSMVVSFIVISLVGTLRSLRKSLKENPNFRANLPGKAFITLRKTHVFLGWTAFLVAVFHSVYYLVQFVNQSGDHGIGLVTATGIITLLSFGYVVWQGFRFQHRTGPLAKIKRQHFIATGVFVSSLVIHLLAT